MDFRELFAYVLFRNCCIERLSYKQEKGVPLIIVGKIALC
jgi:hypothetical protein